jgi:hypothetical protein
VTVDCYYCSTEGVTTGGRGICGACSLSVCTRPAARADGVFHGERCACGCGHLVCLAHLASHAQGHGSSSSQCFPHLALALAGPTLSVCARCVAERSRPDEDGLRWLNHFLNVVTPGAPALLRQLAERGAEVGAASRGKGQHALAVDGETWSEAEQPVVRFPVDFFDPVLRSRQVFGLAAHSVGTAWRSLPEPERREESIAELLPREMLDGLAGWSVGGEPTGGSLEELLRQVLGPFVPTDQGYERYQLKRRSVFTIADPGWLAWSAEHPNARAAWLLGDLGIARSPGSNAELRP